MYGVKKKILGVYDEPFSSESEKDPNQTAEKEVQETSCWGSGACPEPVEGVPPPASILPQEWGIEGVDEDFFSSLQIRNIVCSIDLYPKR